MDINKVLEVLPHRFPFLLIDRVVSMTKPEGKNRVGYKLTAIKNVSVNEPHFPGHFPDNPVMPGVLQIEALAQAAALVCYHEDTAPGFQVAIASINNAKFRRPVVPGDQLIVDVEITRDGGRIVCCRGEGRVDGKVVVEADVVATVKHVTK